MIDDRYRALATASHLPNPMVLPLVSVCIPAYNAEATLGETLQAVLEQDYPKLDIVVSDNHSTDGTKAIVQQYAQGGVRYCTPGPRPDWAASLPGYVGAYSNANFVLSQGRGDYLCLFHADDLFEPSIVREQVAIMQAHPRVGAVFARSLRIGEDSRPIRMGETRLPDELRGRATLDFPTVLNAILAHSNFLPTPSVMLRRSAIETTGGFDERQFLTSADLDMWLRIAGHGYEIAVIDRPLLKYRISQRQFSGQYNQLRTTPADMFRVLDAHLSQPGVRAVVRSRSLALYELRRANDRMQCAMNLLVLGNPTEARTQLRAALRWRQAVTALKRPRVLLNMWVGLLFLASINVGLGPSVGKLVYGIYTRRAAWRQERRGVIGTRQGSA